MKVAILLNTSWNIYNFRLSLVKELIAQGHQVYAIAPKDKFSERLINYSCFYHEVKMDRRGITPIKDLALMIKFLFLFIKIKPDIILSFTIKPNIYGNITAGILRIPVINNICGLGTTFQRNNLLANIVSLMYKTAFRFSYKVFFQNNDDRNLFVNNGIVHRAISEVLPGSGVNIQDYQPDPKGHKNKVFTFLLIARLIPEKGIHEYIRAITILKRSGVVARFEILGPLDDYRRSISSSDLQIWVKKKFIHYCGTHDDVRSIINRADCVVLPSYREGTPKSLLEAASMGKPLIATDVPGCNNIVKDGYNGFLCIPKSGSHLAFKMLEMLKLNPNERDTMGTNSRKLVETKFNEKIVIKKYFDSINNIRNAF